MRKLATFTGFFAFGIFFAQYLLQPDWLPPLAAVALLLSLCARLLPERWRRRALLAGLGISLAFSWNWLYIRQVQVPLEALADTERPQVTMTLLDYAVPTDYGAKATVRLEGFPLGKAVYYGDSALLDQEPGQTVTVDLRFQSAARIRDDDITNFTSKGVFLLAYASGEEIYGHGSSDALRWRPVQAGRAMQTQIAALFGGDTAAFLTAILTGDKRGLTEQAASDLSEAGLYHILAVSGLHCSFLLTLAVLLPGRHRKSLVAGMTLPLLAFYALLAGGSPSVVRACVMLAFLLAAPLFQRDSDPPTALAAALFLILLANPFAAASISLQLSFGAMTGLLWLTPRLYRLLLHGRKRGKVVRFTASSFAATMGALVFTVPLSAFYFGSLVLVSPLSNLLCLWAAGVVFMTGLTAVAVSFFFAPLGALIGLISQVFTVYILQAAHLLAKLPYHALYFTNPYLKYWLWFAYLLFAAAWLSREKNRRKYALAAAMAGIALVCTVKLGQLRYTGGTLDILMLDVGQGESVLLSSGGRFALVDCGSGNGWLDPGGTAADYLAAMGCRRLDYLILTHYDEDHVSGVQTLLSRLPVDTLLVPDAWDDAGPGSAVLSAAEAHGVRIFSPREETGYAFGECTLNVYPPVGEGGDNERGLAALTTCGEYDFLITGDMDAATERRLLKAYDLPDIEALAVGHHGSKGSTSQELLDALTPETALISVGAGNRYGHPAKQTLRRLALSGAEICRTDLQGTIHLSVN